ncbi:MAG: hypothetical protein VYD19_11275, partial [Myxococcota bacterium]|nr:hypothetical protein [Myxococcota bacterium]
WTTEMFNLAPRMALFHQILFSAWRIGVLDRSITDFTDEPPPQLNAVTFSGFTNGALLQEMAPTEPIGLSLRPQLPLVARADPTQPDGLILDAADLMIDLELGDGRVWATLQVDLELFTRPLIRGGQLAIDLSITPTVSLIEAPLFPVDGARLSGLVETILQGLPMALGEEALNELVDLTQLDLFGIQFGSLLLQSSPYPNSWAVLGLSLLPPAPEAP